jgi:hypothetical protein
MRTYGRREIYFGYDKAMQHVYVLLPSIRPSTSASVGKMYDDTLTGSL